MSTYISNARPKPDKVLVDIANYVSRYKITSKPAWETARYCLMDTLGCGLEALEYPACTKLLGPLIPGTTVKNGAKVPGTGYQLDPVQEAFIRNGGFQCGICTPGQVVAARALLNENPSPSEDEIKEWMMGNLCRCTGYYQIIESIQDAAKAGAD